MTYFLFSVSIIDDDKREENEKFFLTIDKSSLPCNVTVGNQHKSMVAILDDDDDGKPYRNNNILNRYN